MARLPLQRELFQGFLGTHEGLRSVLDQQLFSSSGSTNLSIDYLGRLRVVANRGADLNSTPMQTDTSGLGVEEQVTSLYSYRSVSDSDIRRLVAGIDDGDDELEIWHSTDDGATWSSLIEVTYDADRRFDFAQLGNELVIAGAPNGPHSYDGTTAAVINPTQSPQPAAAVGSAGVLSGHKQYKLVSMIADARQPGSLASTVVALDDEQADLTWTADTNTNVTGYELYATTGTGKVFYFNTYIDGRTTASYTDDLTDTVLVTQRTLQEHGDAPHTGALHCEAHLQRMWYGGGEDAAPNDVQRVVWHSDIGDIDSVYDENRFDLTDAESTGDKITGMVGDFQDALVVFLEFSVWRIGGTGQLFGDESDWSVQRTSARAGAVTHMAIQTVPAGARYFDQYGELRTTAQATLAYLTPYNDIRLFDGESDTIISFPVKAQLGLATATRAASFSYYDQENNEIVWRVSGSINDAIPSMAIAWDLTTGAWFIRNSVAESAVVHRKPSGNPVILGLGGASGGVVFEDRGGGTGTPVTGAWWTGTFYGRQNDALARSADKRWRWVDIGLDKATSTTFTVAWYAGGDEEDSGDAATLIGSATFTGTQRLNRVKLRNATHDYFHHPSIRLKISATNANDIWAIESLEIAYQVLPGLHRTRSVPT